MNLKPYLLNQDKNSWFWGFFMSRIQGTIKGQIFSKHKGAQRPFTGFKTLKSLKLMLGMLTNCDINIANIKVKPYKL